MYVLSEKLRKEFKQPFGELIKNPDKSTIETVVRKRNPVVCVGDRVTYTLLSFNLHIDVAIVDYRSLRKPFFEADSIKDMAAQRMKFRNPAGTISTTSERKIKKAMKRRFPLNTPILMEVDGEEDLLLLPAVIHAPQNAVIFYGQPGEGMVAVFPNDELRKKMSSYLAQMEESNGDRDIE